MNSLNNSIRSMSFNIRYDNPYDGVNEWKFRKNMVADMIRFHGVDIAGLQEVLHNQLQDIEALLPDYGWIGVGRDDGEKAGEYALVLYLKERFEPKDSGVFWLSDTPDIPGSIGWDAACIRMATWVLFNDRQTGKSFYFFNTHFDHEGLEAMKKSSYLLMDRIERLAGEMPVVVTGDFNNVEESEVYRILTGKDETAPSTGRALTDTCYASINGHHGPDETYHGFHAAKLLYHMFEGHSDDACGNNGTYKMEKIDYIFIKNKVEVLQHGVLSDTWNGKYPSDHMPVVADICL